MKKVARILALSACFILSASAQTIPNAGFETWANGNPTSWFTSNIPGFLVPVTQSAIAHGGASALLGTVLWFSGSPYPPFVQSGDNGAGVPISSRPAAVHGWYTFATDSGDGLTVILAFKKNGTGMGFGVFTTSTPQTTYREFVANATYNTGEIPDTIIINVATTSSTRLHLGTAFKLDDLFYGAASDVKEIGSGVPVTFALEQNYPNPFNPTTKIEFQISEVQPVTLKVYNLLGQEVAVLVEGRLQPGRYRAELDASNLPSGMYTYRLQAGSYSESKKMIVVK